MVYNPPPQIMLEKHWGKYLKVMKNISEENCLFDQFSVQLKNEWKQQAEV
jgi:hypothetical protein